MPADIGWDAAFAIDLTKGGTYTAVAEVVAIQIPGFIREAVESTHLKSAGGYKEYIPGLKDMGEATITLNWTPSATEALITAFGDEDANFQITAPNGVMYRFTGFCTAYDLPEMTPGGKMESSATFRPTGPMTVHAA